MFGTHFSRAVEWQNLGKWQDSARILRDPGWRKFRRRAVIAIARSLGLRTVNVVYLGAVVAEIKALGGDWAFGRLNADATKDQALAASIRASAAFAVAFTASRFPRMPAVEYAPSTNISNWLVNTVG